MRFLSSCSPVEKNIQGASSSLIFAEAGKLPPRAPQTADKMGSADGIGEADYGEEPSPAPEESFSRRRGNTWIDDDDVIKVEPLRGCYDAAR